MTMNGLNPRHETVRLVSERGKGHANSEKNILTIVIDLNRKQIVCNDGDWLSLIYPKKLISLIICKYKYSPFSKSAPFSVQMLTSLRPGLLGHLTDSRKVSNNNNKPLLSIYPSILKNIIVLMICSFTHHLVIVEICG